MNEDVCGAETLSKSKEGFYDAFAVPWHPTTRNEPRSQHPPISLFVPRFYIQLRTSRTPKNHADATLYLFAPRFYIHFPLSPHAPSPPPLTLARGGDGEVRDLLESTRISRPRICLRDNRIVLIPVYFYFEHWRCVLVGCGYGARGWTVGTGRTKKATLLLPDDTLDTYGRFLGSATIYVLVPAQETLESVEMFMMRCGFAARYVCSSASFFR
jgi:hypothetical protein